MTLTGKLSDFEGDVARINDIPKKMLPAAAKWCNDRLKKGMTIDYDVVEDGEHKGWIAKLWERKAAPVTDIAGDAVERAQEKMAKAGFGQPTQQGGKGSCTSPNTPADAGLNSDVRSASKTLKGSISSVNAAKKILIVEDTDGITHGFAYPVELDVLINKQKPGWFVEVTYRTQGDRELLSDVKYAERPANMRKGGSGWKSQPRNEKPMIYESAFKSCAELVRPDDFKGMDYAARVEAVRTEAEKIAKWMIVNGGA